MKLLLGRTHWPLLFVTLFIELLSIFSSAGKWRQAVSRVTRLVKVAIPSVVVRGLNPSLTTTTTVNQQQTIRNINAGGFKMPTLPPRLQPAYQPAPNYRSPRSSEIPQSSQFVRTAVKTVGPSVIRIDCEREISPFMAMFNENYKEGDTMKVSGTGVAITADGYAMTNAHVVENARKMSVQLSNGRSFKAKLVASDEFTDLAVIKVDFGQEKGTAFPVAVLGDSDAMVAGDWVIAVGCPVGLDFTVTVGVVSSPKRSATEVGVPHLRGSYIQTDAALNSGNSGGPLVNDRGEVIGINTMVRTNTEAIGFAIPINRARAICEVLKQGRKPSHAYFGIEVQSLTHDKAKIHNEDANAPRIPVTNGALLTRIVPGSPAESAGLRRYDVITSVNGIAISSADEADLVLDACKPGRSSTIVVSRGEQGTSVDLNATPQDLYQILDEKRKSSIFTLKPPMMMPPQQQPQPAP